MIPFLTPQPAPSSATGVPVSLPDGEPDAAFSDFQQFLAQTVAVADEGEVVEKTPLVAGDLSTEETDSTARIDQDAVDTTELDVLLVQSKQGQDQQHIDPDRAKDQVLAVPFKTAEGQTVVAEKLTQTTAPPKPASPHAPAHPKTPGMPMKAAVPYPVPSQIDTETQHKPSRSTPEITQHTSGPAPDSKPTPELSSRPLKSAPKIAAHAQNHPQPQPHLKSQETRVAETPQSTRPLVAQTPLPTHATQSLPPVQPQPLAPTPGHAPQQIEVRSVERKTQTTQAVASTRDQSAQHYRLAGPPQGKPLQTLAEPKALAESVLQAGTDDHLPTLKGETAPQTSIRLPSAPVVHPILAAPPSDQARHIAQQMAHATPSSAPGTTEITLHPEELGRVRMSLTMQDSAMTLVIYADRQETTDLMRRHIDQLGQTYRQMGFDTLSFSFAGSRDQRAEPETAPPLSLSPEEDTLHAPDQPPHTAALTTSGQLDLRL